MELNHKAVTPCSPQTMNDFTSVMIYITSRSLCVQVFLFFFFLPSRIQASRCFVHLKWPCTVLSPSPTVVYAPWSTSQLPGKKTLDCTTTVIWYWANVQFSFTKWPSRLCQTEIDRRLWALPSCYLEGYWLPHITLTRFAFEVSLKQRKTKITLINLCKVKCVLAR